jgi:hypothetical protein
LPEVVVLEVPVVVVEVVPVVDVAVVIVVAVLDVSVELGIAEVDVEPVVPVVSVAIVPVVTVVSVVAVVADVSAAAAAVSVLLAVVSLLQAKPKTLRARTVRRTTIFLLIFLFSSRYFYCIVDVFELGLDPMKSACSPPLAIELMGLAKRAASQRLYNLVLPDPQRRCQLFREPFENGNDGLKPAAGVAATNNFYFCTISGGVLHQAKLQGGRERRTARRAAIV